MNLSIELKLGMPHTLVESSDTQKSLCSYVFLVIHYSLSGYVKYHNIKDRKAHQLLYNNDVKIVLLVHLCWIA